MLTDDPLKAISSEEIESISEDVVLDLGDLGAVGAAQPCTNISYSGGADTLTIGDINSLTTSTISTITIPSGLTVGNTCHWNTSYTVGTGINYNSTWQTNPTTVSIDQDGLNMAAGTDIKIDGKSLKNFMDKMEERLAILVPDPAKLEKFEALKKAYEHYKTLESLCFDEPKEEDEK